MKLEFLSSGHPRWSSFLRAAPHQFYHWPQYCDLWAESAGGRAESVLITHGDDYFFLPYTISSLASFVDGAAELSDIRSPYGYPGPLVRAESRTFLSNALGLWSSAMRDRKVVSGFIRLDPLSGAPPLQFSDYGEICFRGETVSVDLLQDEDKLWKQIRVPIRKNIQHALRRGLHVVQRPTDRTSLSIFQSIYFETMQRVHADDDYYFSADHLQQLRQMLASHLLLCTTDNYWGEPLAAGMFIEFAGVMQHHLQGTRACGLPASATKLMVHAMILMAKARGNRIFHLGGGRCVHDSLFFFKSNFSPLRHRFSTWHLSFMPEIYEKLACRSRQNLWAPHSNGDDYFPAYRCEGTCS